MENSLECKDRLLVGSHVLFTGAGRVKHWGQQFYGEIEEKLFYLKLLKTKREYYNNYHSKTLFVFEIKTCVPSVIEQRVGGPTIN